MNVRLRLLAATAATGVLALGAQAHAQDAATTTTATAPADQPGADIVVTAQRRSELARNVPISLTALSSETLRTAGINDTLALQQMTPGLKMDRVGNFTLPAIRGVTTTVTGPAADANVAIYLDGVYQPATVANTFDLPDVERVEVLKGPQGTLFGRNATGGAIQVFTKEPSYTPTGAATVSYGNYNDVVAKGFVSAPLVADRVAVSIAGSYHRNDTYYHNIRPNGPGLSGAEAWLIRGKLRIDLTDTLKVTLAGSYSDRTESIAIYGSALNGNTLGRTFDANAIVPVKPLDVALSDASAPQHVKAYEFSGKLQWQGDSGTLTSITAYNKFKLTNVLDADYSYAPNGASVNYYVNTYDKYFSQEVSYTSALEGPLNFVVGAYYTKGEGAWYPLGVGPASAISIFGRQKVKAAAGFGEVYFNITDKLSVIGGLRYSWERRTHEGAAVSGTVSAPVPATFRLIGTKTWDSFTPRASIRYALTERSNVYFTYSQGFKSGVYNTSAVFGAPDLADPETVKAYELGFKGRLSDALTLNVAGFYNKYSNMQASVLTTVNGTPLSFLRNVPAARVWGGELEAQYFASQAFDMRVGLSVLDAKYENFVGASVNVPKTAVVNGVTVPTLTGNTTAAYNASGQQMIRAPKFTASVTANGHADVAGGKLNASASLYYTSAVPFTFDQRIKQKAYATVDARLGWSPLDSGLTVSVYGKNLTDKVTIAGTFVTTVADGVSWSQPRTYGVELNYKF